MLASFGREGWECLQSDTRLASHISDPPRMFFPDKNVLPKRGFGSNKGQYPDFLCLTILFLFLLAKSMIPSGFFRPYL